MTFKDNIDDDDDEYDRRHFAKIERTEKEMDEIIIDLYFKIGPILTDELNKFMTKEKKPLSFHMLSKFLSLLMLRMLDLNVRMHPEESRPYMIEKALSGTINMLSGYIQNVDLKGPRADPKTYGFDPSDLK